MRTLTAVVVAVVLLAGGAITQERRPQDVALQAAIRTETVDGNLESAIKQFGDIAEKYRSDRPTAATALLHLAGVYQKRGDAQAGAIYERILREFADQKEAVALARSRLTHAGSSARTPVMSYRRAWAGRKVDTNGSVSPDGRLLSYVDWETGDLVLHNLADGTDRRVTDKPGGWAQSGDFAEQSAISRDGRSVAYGWYDSNKEKYLLRVADISVDPSRSRTVLDAPWIAPYDWSPDGKWLAVNVNPTGSRTDTRIALVSVADGSMRQLKPVKSVTKLFFSPDGRYLAFDQQTGASPEDRDVYVMALDSGQLTTVAPREGRDLAMGWTPDGASILFSSDRGGTAGLWAKPVGHGAQAAAQLIKSDIGDSALGVTANGALYVGQQVEGRSVYIAEVDFDAGRVVKAPEPVADRYTAMHEWPDWSRDGQFMSYVYARNWNGRDPSIAIRSLETGSVREIPLNITNGRNPLWSPDGRTFVVSGVDREGRHGIHRIDARDGKVTPVLLSKGEEFFGHPEFSPDGRKIYFWGRQGADLHTGIFECDLQAGTLREVIRLKGAFITQISPDGKSIATILRTSPESSSTVVVVPVAGGEPREVIRVNAPQIFTGNASWSADGRHLMINTFWSNSERRETWLVPVDGGQPRKLDLPGYSWGRIRVHPDGRRVAYHAGNLKSEVWVLENFLPAPATAKR